MSGKSILFRADASRTTGYGHFIRSLALAGYLNEKFECSFASFNADKLTLSEYQLEEIRKTASPIHIKGYTLGEYNHNFKEIAGNYDIVVLDNYYFTTQYQRDIRNTGCKVVCIDDMHDRHMNCDLLMTSCPLHKEDFSTERDTKFAGGIEWALLREPFLDQSTLRQHSLPVNNTVIVMGGADPFRLTDKMAHIVHTLLPDAFINIIAGDDTVISDKTSEFSKIYRNISAEKIAEIFDLSDMGILSASTVCTEAFSRRLPVATGYYVDNQKEFYLHGIKREWFAPLGCLLDSSEEISKRMLKVLSLPELPYPEIDFSHQKQKFLDLFEQLS